MTSLNNKTYPPFLWKKTNFLSSYLHSQEEMERYVADIKNNNKQEMLWNIQYPPLYTAGTSAKKKDLIENKYPTYISGRGGEWTYHGPGQWIGYILFDLTRQHGKLPPKDIHCFIALIEEWIINTLKDFSITAFKRNGRVGVWCFDPITKEECKIAAIGIRIRKWISYHGFSLNISPNINDFSGIIPCGIKDYGITSIKRFFPNISNASLTLQTEQFLIENWKKIFESQPYIINSDI